MQNICQHLQNIYVSVIGFTLTKYIYVYNDTSKLSMSLSVAREVIKFLLSNYIFI